MRTGYEIATLALGSGFGSLCAVYYHKRRAEYLKDVK